jgi:hypothetical protein
MWRRGAYRILVGKLKVRRPIRRDPGVYGRKIIRWIFRKWNGGNRLG